MHKTLFLASVCLLMLSLAFSAEAATLSYSDDIPLSRLAWTSSVLLPKFDPSKGILNSATFTLDGHIEAFVKYENKSLDPATISVDLNTLMSLQRPDSSNIVQISPLIQVADMVPAYDGTLDFDGDSGETYDDIILDVSNNYAITSPSDLALFAGLGSITLPVVTTGRSSFSGGGNLVLQYNTYASAAATVIYDYTPVPEPSGIIAMLAGLTGLAGVVARRRK